MNKSYLNIRIFAASSYSARRLTRVLESLGHKTGVDISGSSAAQSETARPAEFDIILVETSDEMEAGFNSAASARLENPKIPIVSISRAPGMENLVRCFACGIDGHIDINSPAAEFDRMLRWFVDKKGKMNTAAEKICIPPNLKTS